MATRVLVVESDDVLVETYRRFLSREGFEVQTATTADDCIKSLLEFAPDVITLEPEVMASGAASSGESARKGMANVPIVVVTRQDFAEAGVLDNWQVARHYVKPVSMARLANAIREVAKEYATSS